MSTKITLSEYRYAGKTFVEVMIVKTKKTKGTEHATPSADPSQQLCPIYDPTGIRLFPVASPEEMGMRVRDNCAEEHIQ